MLENWESVLHHISRPYGTSSQIAFDNPGTEVPGYFRGVPMGRKAAKLQ